MRRFVEGVDRGQRTLFPECLEDWIDEGNPVRAIDTFVEKLDLSGLGFDGVAPEATGRPSYHPSGLLKLYIYGYLNRVQSSRRLEREAGRNVEVMWLTCRLIPDHKTIADFRKDSGPAIKQVCVQFIELCRQMGLLATASIAIDGSKFKAVNTRDKNFTRGKVERRRAQLEKSVARYLAQLDTADLQQPSEELAAKTAHLKEKLVKLESEMQRLAAMEKLMLASPDQQISLTDPDSRSMATSGRGSGVVGYNVQVAVDTEHHLIITHEVTNDGSDRAQLANIASQAKEVLGVDELEAVADRGYYSGEEIVACDKAGIAITLPKPMTSGIEARGRFGKQDFVYLSDEDAYRCPAGEKLTYHYTNECVSAWNKDPVFGVIGIQSGPRDKGPQWLPSSHGSRGWDAGGGDDCEDPSRLFCPWSGDQGDLPGAWRIAQGSPQGHPFRGDGVPVRAGDAAASEDGPLECRA